MRVLALYENGAAGAAMIDVARELAERQHAALTVLSVVPQAPSGSRCGGSALEYNEMLREQVAKELDQARLRLGAAAAETNFQLLIEGVDPPLPEWSADGGYAMILLPARRRPLRSAKHPEADRLRRTTAAEVRVIDARGDPGGAGAG